MREGRDACCPSAGEDGSWEEHSGPWGMNGGDFRLQLPSLLTAQQPVPETDKSILSTLSKVEKESLPELHAETYRMVTTGQELM